MKKYSAWILGDWDSTLFFKEWYNVLSPWEGRGKILFHFCLSEKLQKRWSCFFLDRKERGKTRVREITGQNKCLQEIKVTRGQPRCKQLAWEKINSGEMESFMLILEVMTYEPYEKKEAVLLQGKRIESTRNEREAGTNPYGSSRTRTCRETTPTPSSRHGDSLWGNGKQQ